jgi:hypothetical protein
LEDGVFGEGVPLEFATDPVEDAVAASLLAAEAEDAPAVVPSIFVALSSGTDDSAVAESFVY